MITPALRLSFFFLLLAGLRPLAAQEEASSPLVDPFLVYDVVYGPSYETIYGRDLLFSVAHRFGGQVNTGIQEFFGMDGTANIRLGLAYGLTDNLNIGLGRTRFGKVYDLSAKYRFLRQRGEGLPLSATVFANAGVNTLEWSPAEEAAFDFKHRLTYAAQLNVGSVVTDGLNLQVMATLVYRNLTERAGEENALPALGAATRVQLTPTTSLLLEYQHPFDELAATQDVWGFGLDFTTKRHAFQLQLTNTTGLLPQQYLGQTTEDFWAGEIYFSFRITRRFFL